MYNVARVQISKKYIFLIFVIACSLIIVCHVAVQFWYFGELKKELPNITTYTLCYPNFIVIMLMYIVGVLMIAYSWMLTKVHFYTNECSVNYFLYLYHAEKKNLNIYTDIIQM